MAEADDAAPPGPDGDEPPASSRPTGRLAARVAELSAQAAEVRARLEARFPFVAIGFEAFERYERLNGPALAGHIAFRLFSWLLPVTLMTVVVTGLASDQGVDVEDQASSNLGLGKSLAATLNQATQDTQTSRIHLTIVALSGLLLATSGLLSALHLAHAALWEVPDRRIKGRGKLLSRLLGGVPLFVLILLAVSALRQAGLVGGAAGTLLSLGVVFGILVGLGWILPRRATSVRDLIPGAVVGTALMVGLQAFTTWYLAGRVSRMSATYGAFGIALTLLAYLYLLGQIVVVSTVVNSVMYDDRLGEDAAPRQPLDADAVRREVLG